MSAFVIAELGINHQGSDQLAVELIGKAVDAGADAVKFQTYDPSTLDPPGDRRAMLARYQIPNAGLRMLKGFAEHMGLVFMSTPFDIPSLRFLVDELKVDRLKIASGFLDHTEFLIEAAKTQLPLYVSTGMATKGDIVAGLLRLSMRPPITVMHCVSCYPCPLEAVNLQAMNDIDGPFEVGLSDHTTSLTIPAAAVARGATAIEKHFTLDRTMEGPDHAASLEPKEFAEMVARIREVEAAMGDGIKKIEPCERPVIEVLEERRAWRGS